MTQDFLITFLLPKHARSWTKIWFISRAAWGVESDVTQQALRDKRIRWNQKTPTNCMNKYDLWYEKYKLYILVMGQLLRSHPPPIET